jgi:DNA-binding transcriptional LysR family regulator
MRRNQLTFSFKQLLILHAITTDRSFKAAAQTLAITQRMQMLDLGKQSQTKFRLFDRVIEELKGSKTGALLMRYSNRILNLYPEGPRELDDLNIFQRGKLIVGASQTTVYV